MSAFSNLTARDIMTPDPRWLLPDQTVSAAAAIMRDADVGAVPIVRDPRTRALVGMLTDRDVVVRHVAAHHDWDCSVEQHMTGGELVTANPGDSLFYVMRLMKDARVRRIPITEPGDRLVGIVAMADVARHVGSEAPGTVESLLERLSEPSHLPALA